MAPHEAPAISIVIPTFNRAGLLCRAVESALQQDADNFEVVVSDNCSSDATLEVMRRYVADKRVRYWCNETNLGMVANWRKAIFERARAQWFILLSDDDFFTDSSYVRRACEAIRQHKPVMVFAGGQVCWTPAMTSQTLTLPFSGLVSGLDVFASHGVLRPQEFILANVVFPRADAQRLGFLANEFNLSCDSELFLKLCTEGDVYAFPEPVCVYSRHGSNLIQLSVTNHLYREHNLDHLVNPYLHARQKGVPDAVIKSFWANTQFERKLRNSLLLLRLHDERWYESCRARLVKKIPQELASIENHWQTRLIWLLMRTFRPWFRRRYPMS
ncbi:MAG: hypothetical protein RLZZ271_963 [Pseudomonadota bacterium]|jgi:glycosyltransferase involved in cell wall biosynthesis